MNNYYTASRLSLLLIIFTFFGCKEQLFDSPAQLVPATEVASPAPVTNDPPVVNWYEDVSEVALPASDGKKVDASFRRGNATATIVILGSSTAVGKGASSTAKSWVELMKAKLKKDNKSVYVVNMAEAGFTTYHVMPNGNGVKNRPQPVLTKNISKALAYKPFLVIVNLPTNDIEKGYTDEEILGNYAKLRSKFVAANVNYIVTGTQPRNFSDKSKRSRLLTLNEKLVAMDPAHVVDVLKKLSLEDFKIKPTYAFSDGIHPNDKGHAVVNGYVFNAPLFKQLLGYTAVNP